MGQDTIIISETGYSRGWGKAPYKTVHGLTKEERQAVIDGKTVIITDCPPSGGGNGTGTTLRQVIHRSGRFYHRVPTDETIAKAKAIS